MANKDISVAKSKEILDPITDLFTGLDGGVSFAKLYHSYMPDWIKKAEAGDAKAKLLVETFRYVSNACKLIQKV